MSSLTYMWNRHKQISLFQDIFDYSKVSHSCLKCATMDQRLRLKFPKVQEIRIWTFLFEFCASKCQLSPRLGIVITKLVYFEILLLKQSESSLFEVSNYGPMAKNELSKTSANRNLDFLDCV